MKDVFAYGNPEEELLLYENPRRRRGRRNPRRAAMPTTLRQWTQGVQVEDVVGALGGLAVSTAVPNVFVKDTTTAMGKFLKVALAAGSALVAGWLGGFVSGRVGKAAVLGGLAGTTSQVLATYFNIRIAEPLARRALPSRIGESVVVSPSPTREGETVSMIQP